MLLRIYAITAIVLTLKMAAISIVQGRARVSARESLPTRKMPRTFGGQQASAEAPMVERASRAWRNDLENIPIFLIHRLDLRIRGPLGGSICHLLPVFMAARIVHTICYLNAIQPFRTISFTAGAVTMLAMMIHLFFGVVV